MSHYIPDHKSFINLTKLSVKVITTLVVLCACLTSGRLWHSARNRRPTEEELPKGITDLHCHAAGIGAGNSGNFLSKDIENSLKIYFYWKAFGVSRHDLETSGDGFVIQKISERLAQSRSVTAAVVLALDGVVDEKGELDREHTEIYVDNAFVAKEVKKYPNLRFGASVNPWRKDALERLEQVKKDGAVLIKWLPAIQLFDPADERFVPFYQKLIELKLPLLVHTGNERSFTRSRDELGDPERLKLALRTGVTVIAAHCATEGKNAGVDNVERLAQLFAQYPNLYADISSLTQINKHFYLGRILQDKRFAGRLVYGSDFPLIATPLVSSYHYPVALSWKRTREISQLSNVWDQDVELKKALGVPSVVFSTTDKILGN